MIEGYPVLCTVPGCEAPARYKIAAEWSDGVKRELKTYALCCDDCLAESLAVALAKHATCVLTEGETLRPPAVYERHAGGLSLVEAG